MCNVQLMKKQIYIFRGRWFSPGIADFSTTKIRRHDIAEALLIGAKTPKIKTMVHTT